MDPDATEDSEPPRNRHLKPITRILSKSISLENKDLSLIVCHAASKLLLLGILPQTSTAQILRAFVLVYFDPEFSKSLALRQALSYFLPVFCHSRLKNAQLMAHIAVPIISKLLLMREVESNEEFGEMVGWPVITGHISEWTDGRKVVGATELGLDGKTHTVAEAEQPHLTLAIEILERALSSACSKDERKPLLALLSKLYIAPSSPAKKSEENGDEDSLGTLHGLVVEAVEGKIGMDATQRTYLAKLEQTLTKRIGEVEHDTQAGDEEGADETVTPTAEAATDVEMEDATEIVERQSSADVDGSELDANEEEEEEEEDTMLAGMQGEGTRMPLEDDGEDEDDDTTMQLPVRRKRPAVTEDDIMESLLASEM